MAGIDDILSRYAAPAQAAATAGGGVDDILARYDQPEAAPPPVEAPAAPAPSGVESGLRGLKQGLTLGFGDEIQGALAAAFTDKTYKQARDEARAADEAAKAAHPWLYGGGNLVGGAATALIPGLGLGGTLAATAGKAALAGAAAGLGESKADLTQGEFGQAALDTATGAATGAALGAVGHGVGKVIGGAPARAEAAELAGLKEGVQNSTKVKVFGVRGRNEPAIKAALKSEPTIKVAIERDPARAAEMIDGKLDKLNTRLDSIYDRAQTSGGGVPVSDVTSAMKAVEAEYRRTSATKAMADAVKTAIGNFEELRAGSKLIPFQDLRAEVTQFAKQGFEGGPMFSVPAGRRLKRDISMAMRDVLQEHVEQTAAKTMDTTARKMLQATNAEYSAWSRILDAVDQKATRQASGSQTLTQLTEAIAHGGVKGMVKGAAKAGANALDTKLLGPAVGAVPGIVGRPIAAGFRALQQGAAATAPAAPGYAAAGLRAALLPPDEEDPTAVAAQ